jgi:purine-binding chemotaxis protein CheW
MATAAQAHGVENSERHDQHQYLTFLLAQEPFAIGIMRVREILVYEAPTEVPMMPAFVRGIVNLRGAVVPVIDLAARFGRPSSAAGKKTCVVIVETSLGEAGCVFGVVVDAVNEVLEIAESEIEPPPGFGTSIRADFIQGMGKVRDRFINILKIDEVLSIDEMESLARPQQP